MKQKDSMKPVGPWEVRRRIAIPALDDSADIALLKGALEQLPGVLRVAVDPEKRQIEVRYDATGSDYQAVVSALQAQGFTQANGFWSRFKAYWYQFSDTNAKDNASAPSAPCCNKPPK